jgi:hypothetical protein
MIATSVLAVAMAAALWRTASFSIYGGPPREVGSLTHVQPTADLDNAWIHGEAELAERSAEYRRPLDPDRFRLAEVIGNPRVWVELRVPSGIEPEHFVPPNSFVGRFVPFDKAGVRHAVLAGAVSAAFGRPPADGAWLLVDGESPATTRWTFGLIVLFAAFAAFNVWGVVRFLRPVKEARSA